MLIFCVLWSVCSPERKRRVSSRVTAKREPSPAPTRPSSLRQSVPTTRPPQLVNGKADTPSGGRTRSSARSSTHTPSTSASSNNAASNMQGTTGEITFECAWIRAHRVCVSVVYLRYLGHLVALWQSLHVRWELITRSELQHHQPLKRWHPPQLWKVAVEEVRLGNLRPLSDTLQVWEILHVCD